MIYDGPPSCDDVNNNYALLSEAADASSSGYYRCEGCGDYRGYCQLGYYRVGVEWIEWFGGIIRFIVCFLFSFFFLRPFSSSSSSSLNSYKPTAGDGNGDNVEIFSVFFSFLFLSLFFSLFFLFFFTFYSLPFFVAFSSSAEGAGYKISPADGSALRGSCVVARDATYDCTSALTNDHGQLLFRCTSDLTGLHAR